MIRKTTALKKIAALKKRIWVIQGGQGAGKTFAILILIANHAKANKNKEIFVASQELSKMRITVIKDFINILRQLGIYDPNAFTGGTLYRFKSGSFVKFIGLDKEDLGKGLRSDLVFVNEANKVNFETYRELTSRAKRVIIDFNPNSAFWAHDDVIKRDDAEFLTLTYKDNEFLSYQEVKEIELNKTRAYYNPDLEDYDVESNIRSKYWRNKWNVYGRGIIGSNPNRIFEWEEIEFDAYKAINAKTYYGVDWGTVDPWGILEAKYLDNCLYLHEKNYASENQIKERLTEVEKNQVAAYEEGIVMWYFLKLGIPKNAIIVCDNNRPTKIRALRNAGFDYALEASKPKDSILDGINLLEKLKIYYTSTSSNIKYEQENYSREVDRFGTVLETPEDTNNHLMDPARYVASFLQKEGIIKVI